MSIQEVKDLTFSMVGKSDAEMWAIIREACRVSTPAWRAWEEIHKKHCRAARRDADDACTCGSTCNFVYQDGSVACANFNAHRR